VGTNSNAPSSEGAFSSSLLAKPEEAGRGLFFIYFYRPKAEAGRGLFFIYSFGESQSQTPRAWGIQVKASHSDPEFSKLWFQFLMERAG